MDKITVRRETVIQRLSRALLKKRLTLKKSRTQAERELGDYFLVDWEGNITKTKVDLTKIAKENNCLAAYETID